MSTRKDVELLKTRIAFIGADRWVEHLASQMNRRFDAVICSAHAIGPEQRTTLKALWQLLTSDVIVRVGFPPPAAAYVEYDASQFAERTGPRESIKRLLFRTAAGRTLRRLVVFFRLGLPIDWAYEITSNARPTRRDVYYWIGTDVLRVIEAAGADTLPDHSLRRMREAVNLAVAPHLVSELASADIRAQSVPFPVGTLEVPDEVPPLPGRMTVISYVPDTQQKFYGLPTLLAAARALPEIRFRFFRGAGEGVTDVPANVEFLGHVDDMHQIYADSSVVVRLVEHDGDSSVIAEGLLYARPVIYSFEVPHTRYVPFGDSARLTRVLSELLDEHLTHGIPLNDIGRQWALEEYDSDRRLNTLLEVLLAGRKQTVCSPDPRHVEALDDGGAADE